MAYTPAEQLPLLNIFQWSTPDDPNPRLTSPISSADTTIYWSSTPKDHTGAIITGHFIMNCKNSEGYTEQIYIPAGKVHANGLGADNVIRGVRLEGLDYTTGDSSLAVDFDQDSPIGCSVSPVNFALMVGAMQGNVASGGEIWKIGKNADNDIIVYAANGDANTPYWMYDASANQWVFSNDGVSSTPFGTGAGVTGGDGITVTSGDIDVDLADTVIFKDARTGNEARAVVTKASDGKIDDSFLNTPSGAIISYGGSSAPSGWLLCDGSAVSRTTYSDLFTIISTAYGNGDGSTTFNVPDMQGNVPVGKDSGTFSSLGASGGEETHTLITSEMPAHTHDSGTVSSISKQNSAPGGADAGTGITTSSTGGDGAHNNLQPYLVVNYIIKT